MTFLLKAVPRQHLTSLSFYSWINMTLRTEDLWAIVTKYMGPQNQRWENSRRNLKHEAQFTEEWWNGDYYLWKVKKLIVDFQLQFGYAAF